MADFEAVGFFLGFVEASGVGGVLVAFDGFLLLDLSYLWVKMWNWSMDLLLPLRHHHVMLLTHILLLADVLFVRKLMFFFKLLLLLLTSIKLGWSIEQILLWFLLLLDHGDTGRGGCSTLYRRLGLCAQHGYLRVLSEKVHVGQICGVTLLLDVS